MTIDLHTTTLFHPSGAEEEIGTGELKDRLRENFDAIPDGVFHLTETASETDWVLVRYRATGTHEDESLGIEGTGNELDAQGYASYRFENGESVEVNGIAILRQLGVELPLKS